MRLAHLPLFAAALIPAFAAADDGFVYTRKYAEPAQQPQMQTQQEPQMQQQTPYAAQPVGGGMQHPVPAMGYVNQQSGYADEGYYDPGTYTGNNQQRAYINTGGNIHEIPSTPPGWDSLTTGTSNGGGVLNNGDGLNNGFGSNPINTLNGNPITNGQAANGLLNSMVTNAPRQSYGNVSVTSDGAISARERGMYAAFLGSLLQFVQSQPDTVSGSPSGYNGGWQPVTPAYNTGMPVQGSQPARFGVQYGGTVGVSAPAVPCPNGARGVVGNGC